MPRFYAGLSAHFQYAPSGSGWERMTCNWRYGTVTETACRQTVPLVFTAKTVTV